MSTVPDDVSSSPTMRRVPTVGSIMTSRLVRIAPDAPMTEAAQQLLKRRAMAAAVVDASGRFAGFVSLQGVLTALAEFLHDERPIGPVSHHLEADAPILSEETPLLAAIEAFVSAGGCHDTLAVLRDGEIVGVARRIDLVRATIDYLGGAKSLRPGTLYMSALKGSDEPPPY